MNQFKFLERVSLAGWLGLFLRGCDGAHKGPPGSKSALMRVVCRRLEVLGAMVLGARVPAESPGPLAPFSELAARVARETGEAAPAPLSRGYQVAMQIAERLHITWRRADTSCAQALLESIQGHFDKAAERVRSLLSSDVRLALPAVEAVATEVLGGIAFMTGRYRDASALFERANLLYVSHHLERGWGFLIQIERSEALLLQVDEEGPDAVSRVGTLYGL